MVILFCLAFGYKRIKMKSILAKLLIAALIYTLFFVAYASNGPF